MKDLWIPAFAFLHLPFAYFFGRVFAGLLCVIILIAWKRNGVSAPRI
jgi:hypothetical protein